MSAGKPKKALWIERGCAWAVTFLLTVFLSVTLLGTLAVETLTSAGLHLQVAADGGMLDDQLRRIHENIDLLAEEHGFSAEAVKQVIGREEVREIDRQLAGWWTQVLTEGTAGTVPRWYSGELEEAIWLSMEEQNPAGDPRAALSDLSEMIERTVFPFRETLVSTGMDLVKEKADIPAIVRSVREIPPLGLMLSLVCAGLIAVLLGREFVRTLKHYGTAAAGTGLTLLAAGGILWAIHPKTMIAEASENMAREFSALAGQSGLYGILAAAVLLIAGYACLILYRRKAGGPSTESAGQTE